MTWNPTGPFRNGEGINLTRIADVPRRSEKGGLAAKILDAHREEESKIQVREILNQ